MLGPVGGAVEPEEAAALQDAVDDGGSEVLVVEDLAPNVEGLVGGEDHRATLEVPLVDDVVEDVGRLVAVGEVADLVDHEHVRVGVVGDRLAQAALAAGTESSSMSAAAVTKRASKPFWMAR